MKDLVKTLSTFILYIFLPTLVIYVLKNFFGIVLDSNNVDHIIYVNVALDTIFFILFIIINFDVLKNNKPFNGNDLKSKIISYVLTIVVITVLFFVVKIIAGIICSIICGIFGLKQISNNQQMLELTFKSAPILMTVTGVIMAPVVEELVFRGAIRRVIKNKMVFVIVSGLLFGLVHVLKHDLPVFVILILGILLNLILTSSLPKAKKVGLSICTTLVMIVVMGLSMQAVTGDLYNLIVNMSWSEAVNSLTYITAGVYLALVYVKYDNIYYSIGIHILNNLISYILLFTIG
jgi:membrane protease YdiL (CAAX protease family)